MKAYSPPLSLWRLVEQHVPEHEHEEIKSMLGASLVEQSQELHEEIEMLLDIWREMRGENTESVSPQSSLPEPPDQRDRLIQEICFFVDNVKEKAKEKGIDPQLIFKRHNSQVLDYAAELTRPESSAKRTSSSTSLDGRETPLLSSVDNRENLSVEITDEVQAVNTKLNYLDFAEVCENLRSTLEREVDQLMKDIQFLQSCLDSEADFRDSPAPNPFSREPTLSELREERSHLEKDLLATTRITATPHVAKPSFILSNTVLLSAPPDLSASSAQTWPSPLKADHSLVGAVREDCDTESAASGTSLALKNQIKKVQLLKSPIQTQQKNCISAVESDRNPKSLKSNLDQTQHASKLSLREISPGSLSSSNKNDTKNLRQLPGTKVSKNTEGYNKQLSSPAKSGRKQENAKVTMGVIRRTGSPGRVRVVGLTTVVSSQSSRDKNTLSDFSSTSKSPSDISPSSISSSLSIDTPARPRSAHADRFRKMVLGCRNGD
ncbi:unnamed protein product [Candidula unifasciata]|uniref:Coiled-coil domain-containing protein 24 n=1 Tax=Candidula unifasciata TaxID=100452 RepID=A0A8S3YQT6_9EUPU|nr:unnamed protein product [Candidula unifasciata]